MPADDMEMGLLGQEGEPGKKAKKEKKKKFSGPPEETDYQPFDWKKYVYRKRYIPIWILCVLILVATILISVYQEKVVDKLRPFSEKVRDLPAGWLIPIAIIFVLSFPPLFGEEVIEILCGVVYGLWAGFGIVAAGTYFGQIGNWFAFKYALRSKAAKLERTNLNYGAMARMVRDGGFWMILIIRLSAIPPHFSTAVFSTCDVKFWYFLVSTFFSLPKQIFLVYLGTLLVKDEKNNTAQTVVFVVILVVTLIMAIWIWKKMKAIKVVLLEEQEQRRRAKQAVESQQDDDGIGNDNEWSSLTNDVRNDGPVGSYGQDASYGQGVPYGQVPPPYDPVALGPDTERYGRTAHSPPTYGYNNSSY